MVDLVQYDYLSLLIVSNSLLQAHLQWFAGFHLFSRFASIKFLQYEIIDQVYSTGRHAVQVGYLHCPWVGLEELHYLSDEWSLAAACVAMEAQWRTSPILWIRDEVKDMVGLMHPSWNILNYLQETFPELVWFEAKPQFPLGLDPHFLLRHSHLQDIFVGNGHVGVHQ